jgi:hypothetical protein
MKPLIELSIEQYESLLKWASENSPLYFRLKNAVKTQISKLPVGAVSLLCSQTEIRQSIITENLDFSPSQD